MREQVILEKQNKVDALAESLGESDAVFFTEYRGLTVGQLQEFRGSLREANASYLVMKNSLIKRSFKQSGYRVSR